MLGLGTALAAPAALADSGLEHSWSDRIAKPGTDTGAPSNDGKSWWQRLVPSSSTAKRPEATDELTTPTRNWTNSTEIAAGKRGDTTQPSPQQAIAAPVEQTVSDSAGSRKSAKKTTEAWWWENVGNPPVDALRDCVAAFAAGKAETGGASADDLLGKAIASQCQPQYRAMVQVLSHGLSKARYDTAMDELVRTTFRPAAAEAIASAGDKAGPVASEPADVGTAKQAMFDCFNREADALAVQDGAAAQLLAREVVARCDEVTRAFFADLFTAYPVDPKAHDASIRIAVEQNYMPAIAARIAIVRQGQLTPVDDTTGNAADAPVNTTVVIKQ